MMLSTVLSADAPGLWDQLSLWYKDSLIKEILDHLTEQYFSVDLYAYDNFSFSPGTAGKIQNLIFAIVIGLCLASLIAVYLRVVPGGFVRALLKAEATDVNSAKTLRQLGYFRSTAIRRELSKGVNLRRVVLMAEDSPNQDEVQNAEQEGREGAKKNIRPAKINFLTARFYIPQELRDRAEIRYCKKGSDPRLLILVPVLALALAALVGYFLPDLLRFADNLINLTAG